MLELNLREIEFHSPWFLLLFLLFIFLLIKDLRRSVTSGIKIPSGEGIKKSRFSMVFFILKISKYIILSALIIGLARPRTSSIFQNPREDKGIDIILSVDISYSMLSKDLKPDRLRALQKIASNFIEKRINDRRGLVVYSGEAFLKVPLTRDHEAILNETENLNPDELKPGTAIGDGLAVAVKHLKKNETRSKVIILMTDGVQTLKNSLNPLIAAELAKKNSIKVYTIGIGTNGYALAPTSMDMLTGKLFFSREKVEIDEETLQKIAITTGGKYFRATSNDSLEKIYEEINNLETSDLNTPAFLYNHTEYFRYFLWIAFVVILVDALLRWFIFSTMD